MHRGGEPVVVRDEAGASGVLGHDCGLVGERGVDGLDPDYVG